MYIVTPFPYVIIMTISMITLSTLLRLRKMNAIFFSFGTLFLLLLFLSFFRSGKTLTMTHSVDYALTSKWVVFHWPSGFNDSSINLFAYLFDIHMRVCFYTYEAIWS